jgi:hypothetical protein
MNHKFGESFPPIASKTNYQFSKTLEVLSVFYNTVFLWVDQEAFVKRRCDPEVQFWDHVNT